MRTLIIVSLVAFSLFLQSSPTHCSSGPVPFSEEVQSLHQASAINAPIIFEKNLGQAAPQVDFLARAGQYSFLLMPTGLRIVGSGEMSRGLEIVMDTSERLSRAIAVGRQPGVVNYFPGADPLRWRRQIPTYAEVRYPRVFPKIDVSYRTDRGHLEFDFALAAGADPDQIRLRLVGAKKVALQDEDLVLHIGTRELRIQQPRAFQVVQGRRVGVSARWAISDNTASFVLGEYDRGRRLVIDPVVSYVTSTSGETHVLVDGADNTYVSVLAQSGGLEVRKNSTNGAMVYDTVLGSQKDFLRLGAVDSAGNAYVIGLAGGSLPVINQIPGISKGPACSVFFDKAWSCGDGVVLKLDGTGNVVFSTLLGGSLGERVDGIFIDKAGKFYVTGVTASADFPVMNAAQSDGSSTVGIKPCGEGTLITCQLDGFVAHIDPAGPVLVRSTYIGGTGYDLPRGIAVDSQGNVYVTGFTQSADFPLAHAAHTEGRGFAAKYDASGGLEFATYLGGTYEGQAIGIAPSGKVLIAGDEYPGWDGFLRTIDTDGTEVSTWLIQSVVATNVSGNPTMVTGMTIDSEGNAYLTGYTQAYDLPIVNPVQAQNGGGGLDGFVTMFSPTGVIKFSTYLGGSGPDQGLGIAVDSRQAIYVAGRASSDFPLLDQSSVAVTGSNGGFLVKIDVGRSAPLQVIPSNVVFPPQLKGTTSTQTIEISNTSSAPVTFDSIALDSGNFTLANGCGAQVPSGGNCSLQISFAPVYAGEEVTTLTILSSIGRLRLGVRGSGLEPGPAARMSPQTTVGYAVPGKTDNEGLIRVVNFGTDPLLVTGISTTPDFISTTDCSGSLPTSASCDVYLSFSPTKSGVISGSVTISSNDVWGPQTWSLDGFGADFTIESPQSTASVAQGSSAKFAISLTSNLTTPGQSVPVSLSCSGLPAGAACKFEDSQLLVGSASTNTTLTITTSAPGVVAIGSNKATYASFCMVGLFFVMWTRTRTKGLASILLLMLSVAMTVSACGSDSHKPRPPSPSTGTPTGSYTIVVNGTAGSLQRSTNLSLTVN